MCGRFEVLTYDEVASVVAAVRKRMAPSSLPDVPRAHARPGSSVLVFGHGATSDDADEGNLEIVEATWGFQPEWNAKPVFNTRIESAMTGSAMWRGMIDRGRCVIPAASFFEPHATETERSPRTGRPMKRQYRFVLPGNEPLLLAGVREGGRCSVVTCEPNRWVAPIHNRMPLVLRFEEVLTWLSPEWHQLADRSAIELPSAPERIEPPEASDQLTLF